MDEFPNLDVFFPHAGGFFCLPHTADGLAYGHLGVVPARPPGLLAEPEAAAGERLSAALPLEYVEAIPGITQREAELTLCENPARPLRL